MNAIEIIQQEIDYLTKLNNLRDKEIKEFAIYDIIPYDNINELCKNNILRKKVIIVLEDLIFKIKNEGE